MLLLRRPQGEGRVSKEELCRRCDLFAEGQWETLVDGAVACVTLPTPKREAPTDKQKAELACRKTRLGEVSRARHCLTGSPLAPGTEDTWQELQSKRPQRISRELPQWVREFNPDTPLALDRDAFLRSLKTAPRGSSPGPGGCTYEHLKVLMDDQETLELLFEAATSLAQAKVPASVAVVLTAAHLTALSKRDGGVRGIATGCSFRRLVARTLAKQFAEDFEQECSPFQYRVFRLSRALSGLCGPKNFKK